MRSSKFLAGSMLIVAAGSFLATAIAQTPSLDASDAAVTRAPTINLDAGPQFPPYPPSADAEGVEGDVTMLMCVSQTGAVSDVSVEVSSGDQRLDHASVGWIKNQELTPALAGDRAVAVCGYRMMMDWRLDD